MKEILEAINFATLAHEGQFRADKITPYISHPLAVALLLQKYGYDKEVIISGILHDIVEDTKYTHDDMIQKFGLEIADIVQGVTEDKNLPYQERKNKYLENLQHANEKSKAVSAADLYHNTFSILHDLGTGFDIWKALNTSAEDYLKKCDLRLNIVKPAMTPLFQDDFQKLIEELKSL
mgnify:FL=1